MTITAIAPHVETFDYEYCAHLAADTRPHHARTGWMQRAACLGGDQLAFVADDSPTPEAVACCATCPVRAECAIEGLRTNADELLAESAEELWGYWGGLTPSERWSLLDEVRHAARSKGITLADYESQRGELVMRFHHEFGWSPRQIAGELGVSAGEVVDHLVVGLTDEGLSSRQIEEVLGDRSYKWVQRRLRVLRPESGDGPLAA